MSWEEKDVQRLHIVLWKGVNDSNNYRNFVLPKMTVRLSKTEQGFKIRGETIGMILKKNKRDGEIKKVSESLYKFQGLCTLILTNVAIT